MHTPKVAPKELRGRPCRIEIHYYRLALDKGIFGYTVPITNQPVFKVKPTGDDGKENVRTLYWNMLFPIQSNQEEPEQESVPVQNTNVALQKVNLLMDSYFNSYWINMLGWHIFEGGTRVVKTRIVKWCNLSYNFLACHIDGGGSDAQFQTFVLGWTRGTHGWKN